MFETDRDDRGQVGIGTLIVFIAMVLVAAIAAGVLVNTAGFLQATAEDAGQQSVNKVTNRVEVINAHGLVHEGSGSSSIEWLNLTVRLAAGSNNVDMNDVTIKYLSDTEAVTLTNNSAGTSPGGNTVATWHNAGANGNLDDTFVTNSTKDTDQSLGVLNTPDDRFTVKIHAGSIEGTSNLQGLDTGDSVTLDITSRTGGTSTVILTMPEQLAGKSDGEPIGL